jgi:hypothetical protein
MAKELWLELEETGKQLQEVLSSFDQKEFNTIPFEGSWTAGQVAEHVLKSVSGILTVVQGRTKDTDRDPDEKTPMIAGIFLNFDKKLKNPDFLTPTDSPKDKAALVDALERKMAGLVAATKLNDLSVTCLDLELPGSGEFTRSEWGHLVLYHTQRHIHQLKNIKAHLY